jgi:predicted DNA-binding transcriptional regulator YafY
MGNVSNPSLWAAAQRLAFIEKSAWWRGVVNRQDLQAIFGVSLAQASADIQKYHELNPGALIYNLNRKRYEGNVEMRIPEGSTTLEEALRLFFPGGSMERVRFAASGVSSAVASRLDMVALPQRNGQLETLRRVFMASLNASKLRIRYLSVHGSKDSWRVVRPHAWGHDGNRWHFRAWCEESAGFRDFVVGRVVEAEWPQEATDPMPKDAEWEEIVTIKLRPSRNLDAIQRAAIALDYGIPENGVLSVSVRKAMENYLRVRLHLPFADGSAAVAQLEEVR